MARAIDKLIAHWARTKGQRKTMTYDLGNNEKLEVWWSPWTLGEMDRVFGSEPPAAVLKFNQIARVIAVKAQDSDGKRLFADVEEIEIMNEASPQLMLKIATAIHLNLDLDNAAAIPDPVPGEPAEAPKA